MIDINKISGFMIAKDLNMNINTIVRNSLAGEDIRFKYKNSKMNIVFKPIELLINSRRIIKVGSSSTKDKDFVRVTIEKVRQIVSGVDMKITYNDKLKKYIVR